MEPIFMLGGETLIFKLQNFPFEVTYMCSL